MLITIFEHFEKAHVQGTAHGDESLNDDEDRRWSGDMRPPGGFLILFQKPSGEKGVSPFAPVAQSDRATDF